MCGSVLRGLSPRGACDGAGPAGAAVSSLADQKVLLQRVDSPEEAAGAGFRGFPDDPRRRCGSFRRRVTRCRVCLPGLRNRRRPAGRPSLAQLMGVFGGGAMAA